MTNEPSGNYIVAGSLADDGKVVSGPSFTFSLVIVHRVLFLLDLQTSYRYGRKGHAR